MVLQSMKELQELIDKKEINILYQDSKFKFSCIGCGDCCLNSKIRLNSYDIYNILNVPLIKYLGINDFGDLFDNGYVLFEDIGNVGVPSVYLKTVLVGYHRKCIFLSSAYDGNIVEWEKLNMQEKHVFTNMLKRKKTVDGRYSFLCALGNKNKPVSCKSFPVERYLGINDSGKHMSIYALTRNIPKSCDISDKAKEWTLKEWLEENNLVEGFDYSYWFTYRFNDFINIIPKLQHCDEQYKDLIIQTFVAIFYNYQLNVSNLLGKDIKELSFLDVRTLLDNQYVGMMKELCEKIK